MTRLTALIIQSRGAEVHCEAAEDSQSKLWAGHISLYNGDRFDHLLLSTEPAFVDESLAIKAMQEIVKKIRAESLDEILPINVQPAP